MCGRYYISDEMKSELERIVHNLEQRIKGASMNGDIVPTTLAPILYSNHNEISAKVAKWGFELPDSKKPIINARSETVNEKRMFSSCIKSRRCIIPASGFYEWDQSKNKFTFENTDHSIMYMAGLYQMNEDKDRFVILTTQANHSMEMVHHRMPLLFSEDQMKDWLIKENTVDSLLHSVPLELERHTEMEQLSFDLGSLQ